MIELPDKPKANPPDPGDHTTFTAENDPGPEKAPIRFCVKHWDELCAVFDNEHVRVMTAFEVLTRLSLKSIGSIGVTRHRCPICAFRQFDFIGEMATALQPPKPEIVTPKLITL